MTPSHSSAPPPPPLGSATALRPSELRQLLVSLTIVAFGGAALALAMLRFRPELILEAGPGSAGLLIALGVALAAYRPTARLELGLAPLALPLSIALLGLVATALLAAAISVVAEALNRWLDHRLPHRPPERRRWHRALVTACGIAGVVALAGWAAGLPPSTPSLWASTLLFAALPWVLRWTESRARRGATIDLPTVELATRAVTWGLGWILLGVAQSQGFASAALLLGGTAALGGLALAERWQRHAATLRLEHLRQLHHREPTESSPGSLPTATLQDSIVQPLAPLVESTRRSLGSHWLDLRLFDGTGTQLGDWHFGPDGALHSGGARPPEFTPTRPGIHRRTPWQRWRRELALEGGGRAELELWCDPRELPNDATELLPSLEARWSSELARALLGHEARIDALTGLGVRRVFERALEDAFRRSRAEGTALAVVLCDIDRFKQINDRWGHPTGDRVLAEVARRLRHGQRSGDLCCRLGGEEFALLLQGDDVERAEQVAERQRRRVAARAVNSDQGPIQVTVSAGVATLAQTGAHSAEELLRRADEALYVAKETGRDRVVLAAARRRFHDVHGRPVKTNSRSSSH